MSVPTNEAGPAVASTTPRTTDPPTAFAKHAAASAMSRAVSSRDFMGRLKSSVRPSRLRASAPDSMRRSACSTAGLGPNEFLQSFALPCTVQGYAKLSRNYDVDAEQPPETPDL